MEQIKIGVAVHLNFRWTTNFFLVEVYVMQCLGYTYTKTFLSCSWNLKVTGHAVSSLATTAVNTCLMHTWSMAYSYPCAACQNEPIKSDRPGVFPDGPVVKNPPQSPTTQCPCAAKKRSLRAQGRSHKLQLRPCQIHTYIHTLRSSKLNKINPKCLSLEHCKLSY